MSQGSSHAMAKVDKKEFFLDIPKSEVTFRPAMWLDDVSLNKVTDPFARKVVTDLSVDLQNQVFTSIRGVAGVVNELSLLRARLEPQ